jgi:hypothetical protein
MSHLHRQQQTRNDFGHLENQIYIRIQQSLELILSGFILLTGLPLLILKNTQIKNPYAIFLRIYERRTQIEGLS